MGEGNQRPLSHEFPLLECKGQYPWLLYYHGQRNYDITFCTISSSGPVKSEQKRIPELYDKTIEFCCDGWLLLSDDETRKYYSIWNPMTLESFDLPHVRSEFNGLIGDGLMSSSPTDPSCLVLLFVHEIPIILYCRPGDEQWIEFNYGESLKVQRIRQDIESNFLRDPVFCCGKIYATSTGFFYLISVNLDEFNNICSISLLNQDGPNCYHARSNRVGDFLVESGCELFSVEFYYDVTSSSGDFRDTLMVEVNKFNLSTNLWEKVTSLNGRAIFLGEHYSLSCPVICESDTEVGSYIYFTNRNDETLYSYRIEDESITLYLPRPDLPKPWLLMPTWVMPVQRTEYADMHRITTKEGMLPKENSEVEEEENNIVESVVKENFFSDLPLDMLTVISSNFSFVDYMNIRCVNKFLASNIRMKSNSFPRPCLIFSERDQGVYDFVDSNLHGKHTVTIPEAIKDYTIYYAKDGWLLMNKRWAIAFFNPFSKEIIEFPDTPPECYAISGFTFTSLPSSSDFLVIAILGVGMEVCFNYIRRGDKQWRQVECESDGLKFEPSCNSPVFHKGSFYYQGKDGRLGVLRVAEAEAETDVDDDHHHDHDDHDDDDHDDEEEEEEEQQEKLEDHGENDDDDEDDSDHQAEEEDNGEDDEDDDDDDVDEAIEWQVLDRLRPPCKHFRRNYLVECGGDILSVFEGRRGKRVWVRVFKLINDDEDWQEIKSLGKYSLYLSRYSSISSIEERPDMANRIYFPRFYHGGLVYYSMNTKKYHSFGNDDLLDNFYGTTMYNDCAWIEPKWT